MLGSISAAARTVGLTYRGAWDAVAAINNLALQPLVLGRAGGKSGGGASLTEDGRRFLRAVQIIRRELHRHAHAVSIELGADLVVPALSWRHLMRTSARNMLLCKVAAVKRGAVNAEVDLDVSPNHQARRDHHRRQREEPGAGTRTGGVRADQVQLRHARTGRRSGADVGAQRAARHGGAAGGRGRQQRSHPRSWRRQVDCRDHHQGERDELSTSRSAIAPAPSIKASHIILAID